MSKRRKPRNCRICKKSPVWRGGDVRDPGPYCKKCYHKHFWKCRPGADHEQSAADDCVDYLSGIVPSPPYLMYESPCTPFDPSSESLLGLPLGPDEEEWAWIRRTAWGGPESRRASSAPPDPYPDEEDWAWFCEESGNE